MERDAERSATLRIEPSRRLTASEREAVEAEANAVLDFLDLATEHHDVRLETPPNRR